VTSIVIRAQFKSSLAEGIRFATLTNLKACLDAGPCWMILTARLRPRLRRGILRFDPNFEAKDGGGGNRTRVTPKIQLKSLHFFDEKAKCKSLVKVSVKVLVTEEDEGLCFQHLLKI